jgi:hypothetical protein
MLTVANYDKSFEDNLRQLWHGTGVPNLSNPLFFSKKVILNGDEVVAIAAVKLISETYMCLNNCSSRKNKVLALQEMVSQLKIEAGKFNLDKAVSFTNIDESLMKHFGFSNIEYPTKVSLFI